MVRPTKIVKWTHMSILVAVIVTVSLLCGSVNAVERSTSNPTSNKKPEPVLSTVTTKAPPSKPANPPVPVTSKKTVKPTTTGPSITAEDCSKVGKVYVAKGFPIEGATKNPISGTSLTVCSASYTCCTRYMEQRLYQDVTRRVQSNYHSMLRKPYLMLEHREAQLKNYLHKLLNNSYKQLHKMFIQTYGLHYNANSNIFIHFYRMMHEYLRGSKDNVGKIVDKLFDDMGTRMIKMLNMRENLGSGGFTRNVAQESRLLSCLNRQFKGMRAYGNGPNEIKKDLIRSLTAGRTLVMVLGVQREVLARVMSNVLLTPECQNALTRVNYCALCVGNANARACPNFCENVLRGCFAQVYKIDEDWTKLSNRALKLVNLLDGRNSLEHIFENSLSVKISEAITNFQTNFQKYKPKLYSRCRSPYRHRRSAQSLAKSKRRRRRRAVFPRNRGFTSQPQLKRLLFTLKNGVLVHQRKVWTSSVDNLCKKSPFRTSTEALRCWNGTAMGPYEGALVPATLAGQVSNPEVAVDVDRVPVVMAPLVDLLKNAEQRVSSAISEREVKPMKFTKTGLSSLSVTTRKEPRPNRGRLPDASGDGPIPIAASGDGELPRAKPDDAKKTQGPPRGISWNPKPRPINPKSEQPPPDDENAATGPAPGSKLNRKPWSGVEGSGMEGSGTGPAQARPSPKSQPAVVPQKVPRPEPKAPVTPLPPRRPTPRLPVDDVDVEGSGRDYKPDSKKLPPLKKEPERKDPNSRQPKPDRLPDQPKVDEWRRGEGKRRPLPTIPDDQEGNGSGDLPTSNWRDRPWPRRGPIEASGGSGMPPVDTRDDKEWETPKDPGAYPSQVWMPKEVSVVQGPGVPIGNKKDYEVVGENKQVTNSVSQNYLKNRDCHPKCKAPISTAVNNLLLLLTVALLSAALLV